MARGVTIAIGADTKEFSKGLNAMNKGIRDTSKQVDNLEKSLQIEFDANNFLRAQKLAREAIEQTDEKAKTLKERLKYLEETGSFDTAEYRKVQDELVKTEIAAVKLKDRLDEINKLKLNQIADSVKGVGDGLAKVGGALTKGVTAPIVGAATALTTLAKKSADTADELSDTSKKLGLTVEQFQEWRYVATLLGADAEKMQQVMIKTNSVLGDIATGVNTEKLAETLAKVGLSIEDLQGVSTNDGFEILRSAISGLSSDTEKLGIASELFGDKIGAELLPMLNAEASSIQSLKREANELGIITSEQVEVSGAFNDSLDRLKQAATALAANLSMTVLPALTAIVEMITEKAVPVINGLIEKWNGLDESTQKIIVTVAGVAAAVGPVLLIVGKLTSGVGSFIKSLDGVSKALTFLQAHPVVAVIGVVVGLLATLYATNENFRSSINNLVGTLSDALMPVLSVLGEVFNTVIQAIMPIINLLGDQLAVAVNHVATILQPVIWILTNILVPVFNNLMGVFQFLTELIMGPLGKAFEWFGELMSKVFTAIEKSFKKTVEWVLEVINVVIDGINWLVRQLNKVGNILGFELKEVQKIKFEESSGKSSSGNVMTPPTTPITPTDAISRVPATPIASNVVTDNSTKNITINLTIENYADELDYDDIVQKINLKLAEQM